MSERIYGVALEDSRPLPDGKHHECWVSVGGVVRHDAGLRAIVDAQHAARGGAGEGQAGGGAVSACVILRDRARCCAVLRLRTLPAICHR